MSTLPRRAQQVSQAQNRLETELQAELQRIHARVVGAGFVLETNLRRNDARAGRQERLERQIDEQLPEVQAGAEAEGALVGVLVLAAHGARRDGVAVEGVAGARHQPARDRTL